VKKRLRVLEQVEAPPAEETEFKAGVLVQYYEYGYRYGHIASIEIDDDGDLFCKVQPIFGKNSTVKPRQVGHKSKDLVIQHPKENASVPAPSLDVIVRQQPIHDGRDHADGDHFLRDLYQRITTEAVGVVAAPVVGDDNSSGQRQRVRNDKRVDPKATVHDKKPTRRPRVSK
jgi:hypothetical protein